MSVCESGNLKSHKCNGYYIYISACVFKLNKLNAKRLLRDLKCCQNLQDRMKDCEQTPKKKSLLVYEAEITNFSHFNRYLNLKAKYLTLSI